MWEGKKIGSFCVRVTYIQVHGSQKYVNKAAYYHIPRREKLIRQGPAKADPFHKNEENNIPGRWATTLSADGFAN